MTLPAWPEWSADEWRRRVQALRPIVAGEWDPAKHPRHPAGSEAGGEFAPSDGLTPARGEALAPHQTRMWVREPPAPMADVHLGAEVPLPETTRREWERFVNERLYEGREYGLAVRDGQIVVDIQGRADSLPAAADDLAHLYNATFLHNHPSQSNGLSTNDVAFAAANNLEMIGAVYVRDHDIHLAIARRPPGGWQDWGTVMHILQRRLVAATGEGRTLLDQRAITRAQANATTLPLAMMRAANDGFLRYEDYVVGSVDDAHLGERARRYAQVTVRETPDSPFGYGEAWSHWQHADGSWLLDEDAEQDWYPFGRDDLAARGKLTAGEFDPAKHPRGKTTEESTPGSFAPKEGAWQTRRDQQLVARLQKGAKTAVAHLRTLERDVVKRAITWELDTPVWLWGSWEKLPPALQHAAERTWRTHRAENLLPRHSATPEEWNANEAQAADEWAKMGSENRWNAFMSTVSEVMLRDVFRAPGPVAAGVATADALLARLPFDLEPERVGSRDLRAVVQEMQRTRTEELLRQYGIAEKLGDERIPLLLDTLPAVVWEGWKGGGASVSNNMVLRGVAAEHFGVYDRPRDDEAYSRGVMFFINALDLPSQTYSSVVEDILAAHLQATWETTQWVAERAGVRELEVYRGITLPMRDEDGIPGLNNAEQVPVKVEGTESSRMRVPTNSYTNLPTLALTKQALQSMTAMSNVANQWEGLGVPFHGQVERVVIRATVPIEGVLSAPVFGKNDMNEHEFIALGSPWKDWDAWLRLAPTTAQVPLAKRDRRTGRYPSVVKLA